MSAKFKRFQPLLFSKEVVNSDKQDLCIIWSWPNGVKSDIRRQNRREILISFNLGAFVAFFGLVCLKLWQEKPTISVPKTSTTPAWFQFISWNISERFSLYVLLFEWMILKILIILKLGPHHVETQVAVWSAKLNNA